MDSAPTRCRRWDRSAWTFEVRAFSASLHTRDYWRELTAAPNVAVYADSDESTDCRHSVRAGSVVGGYGGGAESRRPAGVQDALGGASPARRQRVLRHRTRDPWRRRGCVARRDRGGGRPRQRHRGARAHEDYGPSRHRPHRSPHPVIPLSQLVRTIGPAGAANTRLVRTIGPMLRE